MKITTVIENEVDRGSDLYNEHGLCFFIEALGTNILFDTGKSSKAFENFKKLGLYNKKIDYIILSHGHYDHVGGLKTFLSNIKSNPKIVVGNQFFERGNKYHLKDNEEKYIGIDFDLNYIKNLNFEIIEVKESLIIKDNINLISNLKNCKERDIVEGEDILAINDNGSLVKDDFREEIVIYIKDKNDSVLITGCSHNKIDYIVNKIKNKYKDESLTVVGGVHLSKAKNKEIIYMIEKFKKMNIKKLSLCHCSGKLLLEKLKSTEMKIISGITGSINEY